MEFLVKVIPKSSKTEFVGYLPDGIWKVRIAAVPEKGKANKELIEFLARHLGVSRSRVEIVSGATSHLQRIHIAEAPTTSRNAK